MPLIASLSDGVAENLQEENPVHWRDPYVVVAADERTRLTARNILRLTGSGCMVVYAEPARFEPALARAYYKVRSRNLVS